MSKDLGQIVEFHCNTKKKGAIISGLVLISIGIIAYLGLSFFAPDSGRSSSTMSLLIGLIFGALGLFIIGLGLLIDKIDPVARTLRDYPSNITGIEARITTVQAGGVSVQKIESIDLIIDDGRTLGLRVEESGIEQAMLVLQKVLPNAKRY